MVKLGDFMLGFRSVMSPQGTILGGPNNDGSHPVPTFYTSKKFRNHPLYRLLRLLGFESVMGVSEKGYTVLGRVVPDGTEQPRISFRYSKERDEPPAPPAPGGAFPAYALCGKSNVYPVRQEPYSLPRERAA